MTNLDKAYKKVIQRITGPDFRNPIKDFMDENCGCFIDVEENTFEMGGYFKEFTKLVDNLLSKCCKDFNISEEDFVKINERGLQDPNYSKYFEQLIKFSDFAYFKQLMVNRNYQIVKIIKENNID